MEEAAEYIKEEFENYGLKPLFDNSYYQEFPFIAGLEMTGNNLFSLKINDEENAAELKKDFIPIPFSGSAEVEAKLVFAGYGISSSKLNYDDYENLDVKDKIVIVMRYNPEYDNPHSQFEEFSSFRYKASNARDKGAAGIIFVNGHFPDDSSDKFIEFKHDLGGFLTDFPAIQVKRDFIAKLFKNEQSDFREYQKKISENKKPASFEFKNSTASIQTEVKEIKKTSLNVGGILIGSDPNLKNEYLVIGAHFDHLGFGETGSLYRGSEPQIHNGADDNASGTAGVLELAEKLSTIKNKRSFIFLAFSGEELGLLGSAYFVNNSPVSVDKINAMLNLDMVGRLNEDKLIVYGTATAKEWKDLLNQNNKYDLKLSFNDEGFGPSDHSSFYAKAIPVLFFFTGTHSDYHRPSDDSEKINFSGEEKILNYVFDIVSDIDAYSSKPEYVSVPRKETGTTSGWKVYVGTIPDYSDNDKGFRITGVSEDSPAKKAGLKGGDIILSFGGKKITNIYDYVYALKEFVPGDVVDIIVLREEKELTFTVTLEAR
jgi:hypothetical protein